MPELFAELVTPEVALRAGPATAVVLRTSEGDLTVLDGHTPLVGDLVPGVVRIERDGAVERYCVHGGFVQVQTARGVVADLLEGVAPDERGTRVTLLAGVAEVADTIDVARAEAARDAASAALAALPADDADEDVRTRRHLAEGALARAQLRLEAAGSRAPQ